MKRKETVWSYCVIDAEGEVHHDLTTGSSREEVITDISGNFGYELQYLYVHPLPSLMPEIQRGQWTGRIAPECRAIM